MATVAQPAPPGTGRLAAIVLRAQPDRRLLALFRDGSEAAFEEIVRRYAAPLSAYAASIATPDRADDVVQDSFTRAYRYLGNGAGAAVEQLKPWLYQVVRNTALNDLRDEGRHEHDELDLNYDGVEQPPQAFERRAQIASLLAALQELPEHQRDAIVKRELDGSGHDQIAADMGLSPGAVRQLIYRARRSLREGLGMLLPTPLVRYLVVSGGTELAGAGVAGAGIGGLTVLKSGAAVAVVAASLLAGSKLKNALDPKPAAPTIERGARSARAGAGLGALSVAHRGGGRSGAGAFGGPVVKNEGPGSSGGPSEGHSGGGSGSGESSHSGEGGGSHSGPGGGESHSGSGSSGSGTSGSGSGPGGGGDGGALSGGSDGGASTTSGSGSGELSGSSGSGSGDLGDSSGTSGSDGATTTTTTTTTTTGD
jgi:RNA polymerase sigma factor (sigma-70 family)